MVKWSRVLTTTVFGLVFGVICMVLVRYAVGIAFWPMGVSYLLHHIVLGFAIGVSAWNRLIIIQVVYLLLLISMIFISVIKPWEKRERAEATA
jgi:hypothetical protein